VQDGLDQRQVRFIEAAGVRTRVYEAGEGPPLVLLHGGLYGSLYSLDSFSLNLPALARRFRVVAFDKLGQGHTGSPAADADYTYERLLEHAFAVLDDVVGAPAHLVGHSMGALLAIRLAQARPGLARTLVLVDSNTAAPDDDRYPRGAFYRDLEARTPPGPPTHATVRMEPDEQSFSRVHVTDDFVERLLEIALLPAQQHSLERLRAMRSAVWEPTLAGQKAAALAAIDAAGLPCPTLVVWGADDVSAPLPLASALFERIAAHTPATELHVLAQAGHYCYREHPAAFDRLVTSFCGDR
jgi:2-hydroxy-6-oxonona-2,4-dienedioate hydrolase